MHGPLNVKLCSKLSNMSYYFCEQHLVIYPVHLINPYPANVENMVSS